MGLQKRLLKVREMYARRMGLKTLYSDTYDNPHSTNNLIKSGFTAFDAPVRYGAVGTNYWRKDI
jgi:N-acetylglutamate synthase-like GNAT family acetyltransferase